MTGLLHFRYSEVRPEYHEGVHLRESGINNFNWEVGNALVCTKGTLGIAINSG